MNEKLKEKTKDVQTFWHFKHQRMTHNLAVAALMLGPSSPQPDEKPEDYLKRYIPLANAIDRYTVEADSGILSPWW
jgi:hypothetical protein